MNEIVFIMGKSASGKDRIYRELSEDKALGLNKITMYTTRPLRSGEAEGREYHFVDDDTAKRLENENKIIEIRCYDMTLPIKIENNNPTIDPIDKNERIEENILGITTSGTKSCTV